MYVKPLVKIIFLYIKFFISVVKIIKWNNIFLSHYVTYIRLKRILHVQISTLHRKIPWRLETKIDSFGIYIYDVQIPLCQNMFEWWVILSSHPPTNFILSWRLNFNKTSKSNDFLVIFLKCKLFIPYAMSFSWHISQDLIIKF